MTTAIPKRINQRWLSQARTSLGCTVREIDGQPNPSYVELAEEIVEAEAELARRADFEAWVKASHGLTLNLYPHRSGGVTHEPGTIFLHRNKATGKVTTMAVDTAWESYLAAKA